MDELQILRTRVGEMAAEVERLQSVIDEANAQEPVAFFNSNRPNHVQWNSGYFLTHAKEGANLYARPIPAQQSPAVAVHDKNSIAEILEKAVDLYSHKWSDEFCDVTIGIMKKGMGFIYPEGLLEFAKQIRNGDFELSNSSVDTVQSPHITEQDAREIVEKIARNVPENKSDNPMAFANAWALFVMEETKELLNKLNNKTGG